MPQSPSMHPRLGNATASELANLAADEIGQLTSLLDAYVALQTFLFPEHVDDSETVVPTRSELSALLRTLNDALGRQLEALAQTLAALQQGRGACIHVPAAAHAE